MQKNKLFIPLFITCLLQPALAGDAVEAYKLSRYTTIEVNGDLAQRNPIKTVLSIKFPPLIATTGAAIEYALKDKGYKLINIKHTSDHARIMYETQLAESHRSFEHVTLENILKILSGEAFALLVDPISRRVSLESIISVNVNGGDRG